MSDITIDGIIAAMRTGAGWYLRKRRGVLPALWRPSERGVVAPAVPADVVRFIRTTFPNCRLNDRDVTLYAKTVISELRHIEFGMPTIDDAVLELITGIHP